MGKAERTGSVLRLEFIGVGRPLRLPFVVAAVVEGEERILVIDIGCRNDSNRRVIIATVGGEIFVIEYLFVTHGHVGRLINHILTGNRCRSVFKCQTVCGADKTAFIISLCVKNRSVRYSRAECVEPSALDKIVRRKADFDRETVVNNDCIGNDTRIIKNGESNVCVRIRRNIGNDSVLVILVRSLVEVGRHNRLSLIHDLCFTCVGAARNPDMILRIRIKQQIAVGQLLACDQINSRKRVTGVQKHGFGLLVSDKHSFLERNDNTVGVNGLTFFVYEIEFVVDRRFFPSERRNREGLLTGDIKIVLIIQNSIFVRVIGSCRSFALCGAFKISVIFQRDFVSVNVADIPAELLIQNIVGDISTNDLIRADVINIRCTCVNLIGICRRQCAACVRLKRNLFNSGILISCSIAVERPGADFDIRRRIKIDRRHAVAERVAPGELEVIVFTHLVGYDCMVRSVKNTIKNPVVCLLQVRFGIIIVFFDRSHSLEDLRCSCAAGIG